MGAPASRNAAVIAVTMACSRASMSWRARAMAATSIPVRDRLLIREPQNPWTVTVEPSQVTQQMIGFGARAAVAAHASAVIVFPAPGGPVITVSGR